MERIRVRIAALLVLGKINLIIWRTRKLPEGGELLGMPSPECRSCRGTSRGRAGTHGCRPQGLEMEWPVGEGQGGPHTAHSSCMYLGLWSLRRTGLP